MRDQLPASPISVATQEEIAVLNTLWFSFPSEPAVFSAVFACGIEDCGWPFWNTEGTFFFSDQMGECLAFHVG